MNKTIEEIRIETTNKVYDLRSESKSDDYLCPLLGITKPTLYKRLKLHDWKKSEIVFIHILYLKIAELLTPDLDDLIDDICN